MSDYKDDLRKRILKDIDDLRTKIETDEPCPDGEQSLELLISISDRIDECLNCWYY